MNAAGGSSTNAVTRLLGIGIDSLEASHLQVRLAEGALPALAELRRRGTWSTVDSPTDIGSGALWPTFVTGSSPQQHGIHSEWTWLPEQMRVAPVRVRPIRPFWSALDQDGLRVGVLDVPFSRPVGLRSGFEVSEWGAHDVVTGRLEHGPDVGGLLDAASTHPFASHPPRVADLADDRGRTQVAQACIEGVERRAVLAERLLTQRPTDLALIVFPEYHEAAHHLWHEVDASQPLARRAAGALPPRSGPGLDDVLAVLDRAVDRLAQHADTVVVFSLHGMRPAAGIPDVLQPLLTEWGYSRSVQAADLSWAGRGRRHLGSLKSRVPASLKSHYHRWGPPSFQQRLAAPTMLPELDWHATTAFALPTDQHGWVRLNIQGRERSGSLPGGYTNGLLSELEARLTAATTSGAPIVEAVVRSSSGQPGPTPLPDLVLHWTDAAHREQLAVDGTRVRRPNAAGHRTGQHRGPGFCLWAGPGAPAPSIAAEDLADRFVAAARHR